MKYGLFVLAALVMLTGCARPSRLHDYMVMYRDDTGAGFMVLSDTTPGGAWVRMATQYGHQPKNVLDIADLYRVVKGGGTWAAVW